MAEEAGVEPTGDAFAPPNGFEDRAGHRPRFSSSTRRTAQYDPGVAGAAGGVDHIKIFENLDNSITAGAATPLNILRGAAAFRRRLRNPMRAEPLIGTV